MDITKITKPARKLLPLKKVRRGYCGSGFCFPDGGH